MLKVSAFCLEKQKKSVPKEIGRYQYQNKKALISDPIFSEGFGVLVLRLVCHCE